MQFITLGISREVFFNTFVILWTAVHLRPFIDVHASGTIIGDRGSSRLKINVDVARVNINFQSTLAQRLIEINLTLPG